MDIGSRCKDFKGFTSKKCTGERDMLRRLNILQDIIQGLRRKVVIYRGFACMKCTAETC